MRERRPWTDEEIAAAIACTKRGDIRRLAAKLDRPPQAIRSKRFKHMPRRFNPTPHERQDAVIGSYTRLMRRIWAEHERTQRLP